MAPEVSSQVSWRRMHWNQCTVSGNFHNCYKWLGGRIAESALWWAVGWMPGVKFWSRVTDISLHEFISTGSGAHQCLVSNGYWGAIFPGGKAAGAWSWLTTHLYLVPRSTMEEQSLHSPICLHGISS
jgi:hypothetical protein